MVMKAIEPKPKVRTIAAGEFKAKCLQLMDEVNETGVTLIITKRGKPVSQVVRPAAEPDEFVPVWGRTPGVKILGDIIKPLDWEDPGKKWKAANKHGKR